MPKINSHILNVSRVSPPYADPNKIRLHASERDIPHSEIVWNTFLHKLSSCDVSYYPNIDSAYDLLQEFAVINKNYLTLYDGSSNGIRNIFSVFVTPNSKVVTTNPSFPMYRVYAEINQAKYVDVPYRNEVCPISEIIEQIDADVSVVVVSNPSSPVGDVISYESMMKILSRCQEYDVLLVIDEAYIEFSTATSFVDVAPNNENLIVLRTMSKACGAAGARIGYSVSSRTNKEYLDRVRSMNEISGFSVKWLETMCDHKSTISDYVSKVIKNREWLQAQYIIRGHKVICSETNFIHVSDLTLSSEFVYKTCKMPWSDTQYSRLSIPANQSTIDRLIGL